MAEATLTRVLDVSLEDLYATINDYKSYPEFVDACDRVEVLSQSETEAHVRYHINLMKEISYELKHQMVPPGGSLGPDAARVSWTLGKSAFLNSNNGGWELKRQGKNKVEATYRLEIDFAFPAPGFVINKLIKSSLPALLDAFEERASE